LGFSSPLWVQEVDEDGKPHGPHHEHDVARGIPRPVRDIVDLLEAIRVEWQLPSHHVIVLLNKGGTDFLPPQTATVAATFNTLGQHEHTPIRWRRSIVKRPADTDDDDERKTVPVSQLNAIGDIPFIPEYKRITPSSHPFNATSCPPYTGSRVQQEPVTAHLLSKVLPKVVEEANKVRNDKLTVASAHNKVGTSAVRVPTTRYGRVFLRGTPGDLCILPDGAETAGPPFFCRSGAIIVQAKRADCLDLSAHARQLRGEMLLVRSWKTPPEEFSYDDAVGVLCNGKRAMIMQFAEGGTKTVQKSCRFLASQDMDIHEMANFLVEYLGEWQFKRKVDVDEELMRIQTDRDQNIDEEEHHRAIGAHLEALMSGD